jgi:hypothetical protein
MHLFGENEYFMGATDAAADQKSGSSALDWAVAIPAGVSNIAQSIAALKAKQPKVIIQQQPTPQGGGESGWPTWATYLLVGVGIVGIGAGVYMITRKKKKQGV